jgi:Uma2 family endonuclease
MSLGATRPSIQVAFRLSVVQYHRMIAAGVLSENNRVELLDGLLVKKMAHNPPHDSALSRLQRILYRKIGESWVLRNQSAITTRTSEPEPDLVLAEGPEDKYDTRHPVPREIALIIEIADSSLDLDRNRKGRIFATARIEEYWIVNLLDRQIEVYTAPKAGKLACYENRQDYRPGDQLPLILRGELIGKIQVSQVLPKE